MNPEEQFSQLLKKQQVNGVIPFLQGLTPQQRKELAPHVKKLQKEYDQFIQEGNSYRNKMTDTQRIIFFYTSLVCYNHKEFAKASFSWLISKEYLDKVLPWYCPGWLADFINSFKDQAWIPYNLNYFYLIELTQKGFLQPHPHLVARLLEPVIFENRDRNNYFVPEKLELHSVTLQEHIWYLFQFETPIHFSNRYIYIDGKKAQEVGSWIIVFQQYVETGKIDRLRLLKEALLASNRNFNKLLSGWFAGLFLTLKPTKTELVAVQPELFLLFSSPHSKVVNTALQSAKIIAEDATFDGATFLEHAPLLLVSTTKTVVASALQVLEKLGKKFKNERSPIALLAAQALVHKEEGLQKKAASLILKFGAPDEELRQTVSQYVSTLFSSVKGQLSSYLDELAPGESAFHSEHIVTGQRPVLDEATILAPITDLDEFLFLTSQAFDNNETYHFDLVLDALVRLQNRIQPEDVAKLEPAFQRAIKLYMGDWRSHIGQIDFILSALFLDFGQVLMRKYPQSTVTLNKLYERFMNKNEENRKIWAEHGNNVIFMGGLTYIKEGELYDAHKKLLEAVFQKLGKGEVAPLLSTPTHAPCWIHPEILVQRLAYYQQHKLEYHPIDLQIALSRCWLGDTGDALALSEKTLKGEEKQWMQFLLDPAARPKGPFETEWAWMMAALSKAPGEVYQELESMWHSQKPRACYTGQYPWRTIVENYETTQYKWEHDKMQTIKVPAQQKVLRLDLSAQHEGEKKVGGFKKWIAKLADGGNNEEEVKKELLLYDYLRTSSQYFGVEDRDVRRILFLTPNNPEPLLALAIHKCLEYPQFAGETEKRLTIEILRGLHELGTPLGEIGHLFIATCLVCSDKTAAAYAAEIWIKGVQEGTINSSTIGRIIGVHQQIEFIPLKRLNDLIISQLLNISPVHNKALEVMVRSLLIQLSAKPVKHLKKLVQVFFELKVLNNSIMEDEEVNNYLNRWQIKEKVG